MWRPPHSPLKHLCVWQLGWITRVALCHCHDNLRLIWLLLPVFTVITLACKTERMGLDSFLTALPWDFHITVLVWSDFLQKKVMHSFEFKCVHYFHVNQTGYTISIMSFSLRLSLCWCNIFNLYGNENTFEWSKFCALLFSVCFRMSEYILKHRHYDWLNELKCF